MLFTGALELSPHHSSYVISFNVFLFGSKQTLFISEVLYDFWAFTTGQQWLYH